MLKRKIGTFILYVLVIGGAILFMLPFLWMVMTALKELGDAMRYPPRLLPEEWVFDNFDRAWNAYVPFNRFFLNSTLITLGSVLGHLFTSALVAFGFSRLEWRGRDVVFMLVLSTMMLPYHVTMIPLYILFRHLGWLNTLLPLIVPNLFGSAFFIFLLRQFFMTIPKDLDDAAYIDGAGPFRVFWQIILPLTKPALITVVIFSFTWTWNDFIGPLIYLTRMETMTISVGLSMFQGTYTSFYNLLMAASVIALLPLIVLFTIAQRYFIQGIVLTGMKG